MACNHDFGNGTKTCHCGACHRTFSSITAFDMHQRLEDSGSACLDPHMIRNKDGEPRLVVVRRLADHSPVWGQPAGDTPRSDWGMKIPASKPDAYEPEGAASR